jgi:hypothetical protein
MRIVEQSLCRVICRNQPKNITPEDPQKQTDFATKICHQAALMLPRTAGAIKPHIVPGRKLKAISVL